MPTRKPTSNVVPLAASSVPAAPLPPPDEDGDDERFGRGNRLPDDCPVTPLGCDDDGRFYYLDALNQLRDLKDRDHSRLGIVGLFNRRNHLLEEYWPRVDKAGKTSGWRPEEAALVLTAECGRKGPLDLASRVRGPGAWRGRDGELVLHCGDRVLFGRQWLRPGAIDGYVYPAAPPVPAPSDTLVLGGAAGPARTLLEILQSWNWRRPELDPHLLLGWIGAAKIGGALPWRPTVWLTGDLSTGKSTLFGLIEQICGEHGIHAVTDTTPAGIWQRTRHSSLPVTLDEAEAEQDGRKMAAIIRLARTASSGGVTYRGGSEHHPVSFTIKSCFGFGSILIPPLLPQDWSRIAVLELDPLAAAAKPPSMAAKKMRALGEALTRRLVDHWPRLAATFETYRAALAEAGHKARGADQYGILLACADLLLHDNEEVSRDELAEWQQRLAPAAIAGYGDQKRDHQRCLDHIMSSIVDPFRGGGRRTVAQWVRDGLQQSVDSEPQPATANKVLETYGLKVVLEASPLAPGPEGPGPATRWLCVANSHQGLAKLFEGTHWAPQAGTSAPWVQALRRVPDAAPTRSNIRFAGYPARATQLPLDPLLAGGEDE